MPFETFEGPRYTPPVDAQRVLITSRAQFQLVDTQLLPEYVSATVAFNSAGLDPLYGKATSLRTNGETDDLLMFSAIREATGDAYLSKTIFIGAKLNPKRDEATCDLLDPDGRKIRSRATTFEDAASEGLAAASILFENPTDNPPLWEVTDEVEGQFTLTDQAVHDALGIQTTDTTSQTRGDDQLFRDSIARTFNSRFLHGDEWPVYQKIASRVKNQWQQTHFVPDTKELSDSLIRLGAGVIPPLEITHARSKNFQNDPDIIGRRVANTMAAIFCAVPKSDGLLHMNLSERMTVIHGIFDKINADLKPKTNH